MRRLLAAVPAAAAALAAVAVLLMPLAEAKQAPRKVGVIYIVHGGTDEQDVSHTFDSSLQFFQYDPNNVIFKGIIWNPKMWPSVLGAKDSQAYANAATQLKKYSFE